MRSQRFQCASSPLVSALGSGLIAWRMSRRVRAILGSTQARPCCRSSKCYRSSSIKFDCRMVASARSKNLYEYPYIDMVPSAR
ncbi:hypothetical protein V8C40DRAFT_245939 [Trichoderma camerunense]